MNTKWIKKKPILWKMYVKLHYLKTNVRIKYLQNIDERKYPKLLQEEYCRRTGRSLDWNHLVTYNEKMQWAKLYDKDPRKTEYSDKYKVREFVEKTIGSEYLIPLYGVYKKFDDIKFDELPKEFVLKTNNGSNTNIIVKDKEKLNLVEAKKKFTRWLHTDYSLISGFELHYRDIQPLIIAEKLIGNGKDLWDYKFLCFSGKVYYVWVDIGRFSEHKRNVYDLEWNLQPWNQYNYGNFDGKIEKPKNFDKMVELATKLAQGFAHVRVDLYNVDGEIYFGEMTFTNGSGFEPIIPEKYNQMLGNLWKLEV